MNFQELYEQVICENADKRLKLLKTGEEIQQSEAAYRLLSKAFGRLHPEIGENGWYHDDSGIKWPNQMGVSIDEKLELIPNSGMPNLITVVGSGYSRKMSPDKIDKKLKIAGFNNFLISNEFSIQNKVNPKASQKIYTITFDDEILSKVRAKAAAGPAKSTAPQIKPISVEVRPSWDDRNPFFEAVIKFDGEDKEQVARKGKTIFNKLKKEGHINTYKLQEPDVSDDAYTIFNIDVQGYNSRDTATVKHVIEYIAKIK